MAPDAPMTPSPSPVSLSGRSSVRVAVMGDSGTGKSSLIAAASNRFSRSLPHVLPPSRITDDYVLDNVAIDVIDTSSRPEGSIKLLNEVEAADAIVLTYTYHNPGTLERLSTYWLPMLRFLKVRAPVLVVRCELEPCGENHKLVMSSFMEEFTEVEACTEFFFNEMQATRVFLQAQKLVLHPVAPLIDRKSQSLNRRCLGALKRIFILFDRDMDGALSNEELNCFHVNVFNARLKRNEIVKINEVVLNEMPDALNQNGLTLAGFLYLHKLFIERGHLEKIWTVLRKFGYGYTLEIRDEFLPISIMKCSSDQCVELTNEAVNFLKESFHIFNKDNDGILKPAEIDHLFSTAPERALKGHLLCMRFQKITSRNCCLTRSP